MDMKLDVLEALIDARVALAISRIEPRLFPEPPVTSHNAIIDRIRVECQDEMDVSKVYPGDPFFRGWYAAYLRMSDLLKDIEKDLAHPEKSE